MLLRPPHALDKHRSVNAVVESFFDSLKTELDQEVFESREHALAALGNISPAAFEKRGLAEAA